MLYIIILLCDSHVINYLDRYLNIIVLSHNILLFWSWNCSWLSLSLSNITGIDLGYHLEHLIATFAFGREIIHQLAVTQTLRLFEYPLPNGGSFRVLD